jgi:phosphonate transport system substrate-binding protein
MIATALARTWLALCLILFSTSALAERQITLGVFPYVSASEIVNHHLPLKRYLERKTGFTYSLVTAPDFATFQERVRAGAYDLALMAPHMGRSAQVQNGYLPLARTMHNVQGVFLARKDSGLQSIKDLRGKRVMLAEPLSLIYQMAMQTLQRNGLKPGLDLTLLETKKHNNAMLAPLRNEADGAVTGNLLWEGLDPESRNQMQVIGTTPKRPGFFMMAHPRLSSAERKAITAALMDFEESPEGQSTFIAKNLKGFGPIEEGELKAMDEYTGVFSESR